jgi:AcrR family transcriptional regulator
MRTLCATNGSCLDLTCVVRRRLGQDSVDELERWASLEHPPDIGPIEDQREARRDHEVRRVRLRSAEDAVGDPGVDAVEHRAKLGQYLALGVRAGGEHVANQPRHDQASHERPLVEEVAEAGYSKGALYWHFSGKEDLLEALLEEHVDAPMRAMVALLESTPPDRDMSLEATREFARQLSEQPEAVLLEREHWTLAIRDPELRARYVERQNQLRGALAAALRARARHLGTPDMPMPAEDVTRIVMGVMAGLAVDELVEPGSVDPDLIGETLALIYAGLVARATVRDARRVRAP